MSGAASGVTRREALWARLFGFGALAHLTLPDALQWSWLVPDLLLLACAGVLLWRPPRGWVAAGVYALGAVGVAWPLLALGDQLTQSVLMLASLVAAAVASAKRARPVPAPESVSRSGSGSQSGSAPPPDAGLMAALRAITIVGYGLAAFHKLNRDFLDPAVSCATGGVRLLADNWSLPIDPAWLEPVWPVLFLGVEITIVLGFRFWPRVALLLAAVMHVPLTIVFAPAFAWVMLPGWVAFLTPRDARWVLAFFRRHRRRLLLAGGLLGAISTALYFRDHWVPYPAWQIKELLLWPVALGVVAACLRAPRRLLRGPPAPSPRARAAAAGLALVLLANGATPYLGVQFHHAGAMLSNLRVDEGCWNHLLVPESVRRVDPYVRIERVDPAPRTPGRSALIALAQERLWDRSALRESVREWCAHGAAPLALELRHAGTTHVLRDACAEPWPLPPSAPGRYQLNLPRQCPARCIH